jgi:hypothetical protein
MNAMTKLTAKQKLKIKKAIKATLRKRRKKINSKNTMM